MNIVMDTNTLEAVKVIAGIIGGIAGLYFVWRIICG